MADELKLYRIQYVVRRRRRDGRKRKRSAQSTVSIAAHAEAAVRRFKAGLTDIDDPSGNYETVGVGVTGIDELGTLGRCPACREFRCDAQQILCLCDGLRCERCGRKKMHRPVSSYHDEVEERLCHVPWFYAPPVCRDCRRTRDE
jgi:hypothetical protein